MDWYLLKNILETISYFAIIIDVSLALAEYRHAR